MWMDQRNVILVVLSIIYLLLLHWVRLFRCSEIRVGRVPTLKSEKQIEASGKTQYEVGHE